MTQRNDTQAAELPHRADAFAATPGGHSAFFSGADATSSRLASPSYGMRRPLRIAVSLPVVVHDQFGGREETRTQFVMLQGAVLATSANLRVGHKLSVQNVKNGRTAECLVIGIEPVLKNVHSVEVEFIREQPDFWPVQFPSEDSKVATGSQAGAGAVSPSSHFVEAAKIKATEPAIDRPNDNIVSLADSIAGESIAGSSFAAPTRFAPKYALVDSVAQFRAANRAAHRREQRMKTLYSLLSIAVLAAAVAEARNWMEHRPETSRIGFPSVMRALPSRPLAEPAPPSVATQPLSLPAISQPPQGPTEVPHPDPASGVSLAATPAGAADLKEADTQVEVQHRAPLASSRKTGDDLGEEPLALPLRVGESDASAAKPGALSDVVAQVPSQTAVLAPQPIYRPVAAKLVSAAPARYPSIARQNQVEGEVVISLDVDTSGNVSDARAVSGPPILRAAALEAVRRWKYQPATLGNTPLTSTEVVRVQFRLK